MKPEKAAEIARKHLDWSEMVALRPKPKHAPMAPLGARMMVREMPITEATKAGIIVKPERAQERTFEGLLHAAGDQAAAKLQDQGVEIGDHVKYGQFTGIRDEWDRIVQPGKPGVCATDLDHSWSRVGGLKLDERAAFSCDLCDAVRAVEPVIITNADDIYASVDLQVRIEAGLVMRYEAVDTTGKTRFVTERVKKTSSTYEHNVKEEKKNAAAA